MYNVDSNLAFIGLRENSDGLKIIGSSNKHADKGIAVFENLTFQYQPGENASVRLESPLLDNLNQTILSLEFRLCQRGEVFSGSNCEVCNEGKYSFDMMSSICNDCPLHANCS